MTDASAVLERIQQRLVDLKMSERAAEQAARHPKWIVNLRIGKNRNPKLDVLRDFAPVLATSAEWLAFGDGGAPRSPPTPGEAQATIARFKARQAAMRPVAKPGRQLTGASHLRILGEVAAGWWLEVDAADAPAYEDVALPVDARWPPEDQFGLLVRGTSINKVAPDGAYLLCVSLIALRYEPRDGDLVIVEQTRDGGHTIERTAKRFRQNGALHEFWPDSHDPRWNKPIVIDPANPVEGVEVRATGLVVWAHLPVIPLGEHLPRP